MEIESFITDSVLDKFVLCHTLNRITFCKAANCDTQAIQKLNNSTKSVVSFIFAVPPLPKVVDEFLFFYILLVFFFCISFQLGDHSKNKKYAAAAVVTRYPFIITQNTVKTLTICSVGVCVCCCVFSSLERFFLSSLSLFQHGSSTQLTCSEHHIA